MHQPDFFHILHHTSYFLHHRAHARCGAQCGQSRRQNANDDLNHRLPRFLLHNPELTNHKFLSFLSFKEVALSGKLFASLRQARHCHRRHCHRRHCHRRRCRLPCYHQE